MKRYLPVLWFLLLALAACGQETEEKAAYQLYFQEADLTFSAGEGAFRTERIFLDQEETEDSQHLAAALLEELLRGPLDETLKSTIPAGTTLLSMTLEGSRAVVDFSSPYGTLSGVSLTLADSAVLMTLAQVPEISSVRITVRGRDLAYRDRQGLLDEWEALLDQVLAEGSCFSLKQLEVKGGDLSGLGLRGPAIGGALQTLLEQVIDNKLPNERAVLLDYVKENLL